MARSDSLSSSEDNKIVGDGRAVDLGAIHARSDRFRRKLQAALSVIGQALRQSKRPYVAFSGGKDSLAVLGLVEHLRPDIDAHWSDDELEFPETLRYMEAMELVSQGRLQITQGVAEHAGWFRPWTDRPYWRDQLPGTIRIDQDADDWWASVGYDLTFLGTRASENARRAGWLRKVGPLYRVNSGTGWRCCPVWDWTEDDVWAAIAAFGWPYNPAYDIYHEAGVLRRQQRVGPMPLTPRRHLEAGWPDVLARLETRYARRWAE